MYGEGIGNGRAWGERGEWVVRTWGIGLRRVWECRGRLLVGGDHSRLDKSHARL